jgi:tetratricopeptide (TPR) repeat protein
VERSLTGALAVLALVAGLGLAFAYFGGRSRNDPFGAPVLASRAGTHREPTVDSEQPQVSRADTSRRRTTSAPSAHDEIDTAPALAAPPASNDGTITAAPSGGSEETGLSEADRKNREAVTRAASGDMPGAEALLREAHRLEPANGLVAKNLQATLINLGFDEIAGERFDRAVARFVEALTLGERGEIRRGLGYAYYRLGHLDLAQQSLERARRDGAADAETYLTLGQIYLERRDQPRALAMLEQALAAGADRPGLASTVARLRRDAEVEEGFHALASSHFVLKFEGRENTQAGRVVLNTLEDAYRTVGARFAYYPLDRLEVILYPDEAFREVTNSPHWSGGVYDGRIKLPIGGLARGSERLSRTLRHEYAHAAIVTLSRTKAPVWLNEGLAQVAEDTGDEGRGGRLQRALAEGGLIALSELEHGFTRLDREQASLAYAEAYFAAEYLLRQKGSYNVRRLLETMATAETTDAAFRQALGLSYPEFETRFFADIERRTR